MKGECENKVLLITEKMKSNNENEMEKLRISLNGSCAEDTQRMKAEVENT